MWQEDTLMFHRSDCSIPLFVPMERYDDLGAAAATMAGNPLYDQEQNGDDWGDVGCYVMHFLGPHSVGCKKWR